MPATCPSCNTVIPWHQQQPHFTCPNCDAELSSNLHTLCLRAAILWVLIDIPLFFIDDGTALGFITVLVTSIILGCALFYVIIHRFNRLLLSRVENTWDD